nr:hypothetical protein [uncultured Mediterranean phage uvMED]
MAEMQNNAPTTPEAQPADNEMQVGGSVIDYAQIPVMDAQPKMINPLTENLDDNWDVSNNISEDTQWVIGDFNMPELRVRHDKGLSTSYLMGLGESGEAFEIESQDYGQEPAKPTEADGAIMAMLGQGVRGALEGFKEISKVLGDDYPDRIERLFPYLLAAQTPVLLSGEDPAEFMPPERDKDSIGGQIAYDLGRVGSGFAVGGAVAASLKLAKNLQGFGALGTNLLRVLSSGMGRSAISGGIAEAVTLPADEKSMIDEFLTPYITSLGDDEQQSLANTMIDTYSDVFAKDPEASEILNDLRVFNAGTVEGAAADAVIRGLMFGIKKIGVKRLLAAGGLLTGAFAGSEAEAGPISPLLEVFGLGPDRLGFYSKAAREVDQVAQESMTPDAWRSYLFEGRQPRMRKEEWEWLGMDDFFARPRNRDTIDKDDILEHIRANQLVIEEERLAGGSVDPFGEGGEAFVYVTDEPYNEAADFRDTVANYRNPTSYDDRERLASAINSLNRRYDDQWGRGNLLAGDIEVSTVESAIERVGGDIDYDEGEYAAIVEFVNYDAKPKRDAIANDIRRIFEDFGDVETRRNETDLAEEYGDLSGEVTNEDFVDSLRTQVQTAGEGAPLFPDTPITTPNGAVLTREQALQIIDDYDTGMDPMYVTYSRSLENAKDGESFGQVLREIQENFFSDIQANDALYDILHRQSEYRIEGVAGLEPDDTFTQYENALEEAQNRLRANVQRQVDQININAYDDAVEAAGDEESPSELIHGRAKWDMPKYRTPGGRNYREFALRFADEQGITPAARMGEERFRESHFGKGVFAHARMSEHEVLGDKTYTIEEVQSSQHQQGYAKGYKRADKPRQFEEPFQAIDSGVGYFEVQDANGAFITNVMENEPGLDRIVDSANTAIALARRRIAEGTPVGGQDLGVPDAPFKTTWHEFTLKRLITDAVQRGYDRIAWTPEAVQTERYGSAAVPDLYKLIYEQRMPQWTRKWLKKTDPDVQLETTDVGTKQGYFTFKLTDKIKNAVEQGNFELFAVGTPLAAALTAIQTGGMFVPEDEDLRGGMTKQQYIAARRQAIAEGRSQAFVDRHFPIATEPPPQPQPVY